MTMQKMTAMAEKRRARPFIEVGMTYDQAHVHQPK
jgi:hypothetical protein